jgi:hypothetical protein
MLHRQPPSGSFLPLSGYFAQALDTELLSAGDGDGICEALAREDMRYATVGGSGGFLRGPVRAAMQRPLQPGTVRE